MLSTDDEEICDFSLDSATFRKTLPEAVVLLAAGTVNQTCMLVLGLCPVITPWCPHSFSQGLFLTELPWQFFLHLCYPDEGGNPNCCHEWQKANVDGPNFLIK